MKNKNIFVACDTSNLNEIKKIIKESRNNIDIEKIKNVIIMARKLIMS